MCPWCWPRSASRTVLIRIPVIKYQTQRAATITTCAWLMADQVMCPSGATTARNLTTRQSLSVLMKVLQCVLFVLPLASSLVPILLSLSSLTPLSATNIISVMMMTYCHWLVLQNLHILMATSARRTHHCVVTAAPYSATRPTPRYPTPTTAPTSTSAKGLITTPKLKSSSPALRERGSTSPSATAHRTPPVSSPAPRQCTQPAPQSPKWKVFTPSSLD